MAWLAQGACPGSGAVLLVSPPNAGKTWCALWFAKLALAMGRNVLLVEEEGSLKGLANRIKALAFDPEAGMKIAFRRAIRLSDEEQFAQIYMECCRTRNPVLVLDPYVSIMSGDENSPVDTQATIRKLNELLAIRGLLLILLHHSKKAHRDVDAVYESRGHTMLSGWADTILSLRTVEHAADDGEVLFTVKVQKQREAEVADPIEVRIELGSGNVTSLATSESRQSRTDAAILEAIGNSTLQAGELAQKAGGRRQFVLSRIRGLVTERKLRQLQDGKLERA